LILLVKFARYNKNSSSRFKILKHKMQKISLKQEILLWLDTKNRR